jgi:hypothetical protein
MGHADRPGAGARSVASHDDIARAANFLGVPCVTGQWADEGQHVGVRKGGRR